MLIRAQQSNFSSSQQSNEFLGHSSIEPAPTSTVFGLLLVSNQPVETAEVVAASSIPQAYDASTMDELATNPAVRPTCGNRYCLLMLLNNSAINVSQPTLAPRTTT